MAIRNMYLTGHKISNLIFLSGIILLTACGTSKKLPIEPPMTIERQIEESAVFSKIFTGFALYDPGLDSMLYSHEADKYYTPASNTKLFTFYTTLKVLGDSLPLYRLAQRPGVNLIQGTGNPMFLHPDFEVDSTLIKDLMSLEGLLYLSTDNYTEERFGPGWSWADYAYYYQVEKAAFPVFGNIVRVERDTLANSTIVHPDLFASRLYYDPALNRYDYPAIRRDEFKNQFAYNNAFSSGSYFSYDLPLYGVKEEAAFLLGKTIQEVVRPHYMIPADSTFEFKQVYGPLPDTLLRKFLQESDNFIAEQLLLSCSAHLFEGRMSTADAIQYATDSLLADLPDPIRWVDGSGLSRYNLFTPRSIIRLLEKLYDEYPEEWLFSLLPQGGKKGTIKSWYGGKDAPYVFAKTGTLSNKHCLSGYIRTKSGKVLLFSFMNNNYIGSTTPIKEEMQKVLEWIWATY